MNEDLEGLRRSLAMSPSLPSSAHAYTVQRYHYDHDFH